ncbi:MAG: hypothetical protein IKM28_00665 [Lachnospiraceae bacterium]|nr:hypothetical protein [Lachnospiraceae bacterium]
MLLNCSNHASKNWNPEQLKAAAQWGEIVDYSFPIVPATADEADINRMAEDMVKEIKTMQPSAVMCQGEFTLSYMMIMKLLQSGIKVVAACSDRQVEERVLADGNIEKKVVFQFIRFREYRINI